MVDIRKGIQSKNAAPILFINTPGKRNLIGDGGEQYLLDAVSKNNTIKDITLSHGNKYLSADLINYSKTQFLSWYNSTLI